MRSSVNNITDCCHPPRSEADVGDPIIPTLFTLELFNK